MLPRAHSPPLGSFILPCPPPNGQLIDSYLNSGRVPVMALSLARGILREMQLSTTFKENDDVE